MRFPSKSDHLSNVIVAQTTVMMSITNQLQSACIHAVFNYKRSQATCLQVLNTSLDPRQYLICSVTKFIYTSRIFIFSGKNLVVIWVLCRYGFVNSTAPNKKKEKDSKLVNRDIAYYQGFCSVKSLVLRTYTVTYNTIEPFLFKTTGQ